MFLTAKQIPERLKTGELVVDPIIEDTQIGGAALDLRLGTEIARLPEPEILDTHNPEPLDDQVFSVKLGDSFMLHSGSAMIATNLEFLAIPEDLSALLFPRPTLGRLGLLFSPSMVDPGYQGTLAFCLHNVGQIPIKLYPGVRILRMVLLAGTALSSAPSSRYKRPAGRTHATPTGEIEKLEQLIANSAARRTSHYTPKPSLSDLLATALQTSGPPRGAALERFAAEFLQTVKGLQILSRNVRLEAEELDLLVQNDITTGFWRFAGSPIVVECKNWSNKVGAREIAILVDKLKVMGPDARTGILIAPNGVTGPVRTKLRDYLRDGLYILVLDHDDLQDCHFSPG